MYVLVSSTRTGIRKSDPRCVAKPVYHRSRLSLPGAVSLKDDSADLVSLQSINLRDQVHLKDLITAEP